MSAFTPLGVIADNFTIFSIYYLNYYFGYLRSFTVRFSPIVENFQDYLSVKKLPVYLIRLMKKPIFNGSM
jgi:hypothetical protein